MNETTEKKLSKHLQAAVNHLEKQYDKYGDKLGDLQRKVEDISDQMEVLNDLRSDLYEQIKKLKGETPLTVLEDISKAGLK